MLLQPDSLHSCCVRLAEVTLKQTSPLSGLKWHDLPTEFHENWTMPSNKGKTDKYRDSLHRSTTTLLFWKLV